MAIWSQNIVCVLCGMVRDTWLDHALHCLLRGDKITRHQAVLDAVFSAARDQAGHHLERERCGVFPPSPAEGDDRPPGWSDHRSPTDVCLPRVVKRVFVGVFFFFSLSRGVGAAAVAGPLFARPWCLRQWSTAIHASWTVLHGALRLVSLPGRRLVGSLAIHGCLALL